MGPGCLGQKGGKVDDRPATCHPKTLFYTGEDPVPRILWRSTTASLERAAFWLSASGERGGPALWRSALISGEDLATLRWSTTLGEGGGVFWVAAFRQSASPRPSTKTCCSWLDRISAGAPLELERAAFRRSTTLGEPGGVSWLAAFQRFASLRSTTSGCWELDLLARCCPS